MSLTLTLVSNVYTTLLPCGAHFLKSFFNIGSFRSADVLAYKDTPRISFYIVVKNPAAANEFFPREDVEAAIR